MFKLEKKSVEIGFNFDEVKGIFTGYASVFNEIDRVNDTVDPEAYNDDIKKWKENNKSIPINFEHEKEINLSSNLIEMATDQKGLLVKWQFSEEAKALYPDIWKWAVEKAKSGELFMSIGYKAAKSTLGKTRYIMKNKFLTHDTLYNIDLDHIAITDNPVDTKAEIIEVKSSQEPENLNISLKKITGKVAAKKFLKENKNIISNNNVENFVNHLFDIARNKNSMIEVEEKSQCEKTVSASGDKNDDINSLFDEIAIKLNNK